MDPVLFIHDMQAHVSGSTEISGLPMAAEISSLPKSTTHLAKAKPGTTASESVDITELRLLLSSPQQANPRTTRSTSGIYHALHPYHPGKCNDKYFLYIVNRNNTAYQNSYQQCFHLYV